MIIENYEKLISPSNEVRETVDLIPMGKRTWEEKMIYLVDHSQIVDERYFKSDSGEPFRLGDKRLNCLIDESDSDNKIYRSTSIKAGEIGILYDLIENDFSIKSNVIIVKSKK